MPLAAWWVVTLQRPDCLDRPHPPCASGCSRAAPGQSGSSRGWWLPGSLSVPFVWLVGLSSGVGGSPPLVCWPGLQWRSTADVCDQPWAPHLELPHIGSLWLSTGRGGVGGQAVSQDWLPEALSWGQMKSPRLLGPTTYQLLPLRFWTSQSSAERLQSGPPGQARRPSHRAQAQ